MEKKVFLQNPFLDAANILHDYSQNGDRAKAQRRCQMEYVNYNRFKQQDAKVFLVLKTVFKQYKTGR